MTTIRRLARPALGLVLLAGVLLAVDPTTVIRQLVAADLTLVLIGVIGLTATHLLVAGTWRHLVRRLSGVRLPWRSAVPVSYAAQAIGGMTPGNVGGDLHRIVAVRAGGHGAWASVAPVVVLRVTSLAALALLGLIALVPIAGRAPAAAPFVVIGLAFAVALAAVLGAVAVPGRGPVASLRARFARLVGFGDEPPSMAAPRGRLLWASVAAVGLGLCFHLAAVTFTWLLVGAVDPGQLTLAMLCALAIARLSLAVPITPSGVGVQEGALAILVVQLGRPPDAALAGLLLARLAMLITAVIGAVVIARRSTATMPSPTRPMADGATPANRG